MKWVCLHFNHIPYLLICFIYTTYYMFLIYSIQWFMLYNYYFLIGPKKTNMIVCLKLIHWKHIILPYDVKCSSTLQDLKIHGWMQPLKSTTYFHYYLYGQSLKYPIFKLISLPRFPNLKDFNRGIFFYSLRFFCYFDVLTGLAFSLILLHILPPLQLFLCTASSWHSCARLFIS